MNTGSNDTPPRSQTFVPLIVAAVAGFVGLGLLLLMLASATTLVRLGFTGYFWYVLLIALGLASAVTVFYLFKSYAGYTGKVLGGRLQLGGPVVVMFVVIILGFHYVSTPAQQFDVTIFLDSEIETQPMILRNSGKLFLELGKNKPAESVGDKGEVRFFGIPANMRGEEVELTLIDDKYELVNRRARIRLDRDVFHVAVRAKRLPLKGHVLDDRGQPLAQAHASIAGTVATTDQEGKFEIILPADLPESDRTLAITAYGYETWRAQAVPGGNPLQVRLLASPDRK